MGKQIPPWDMTDKQLKRRERYLNSKHGVACLHGNSCKEPRTYGLTSCREHTMMIIQYALWRHHACAQIEIKRKEHECSQMDIDEADRVPFDAQAVMDELRMERDKGIKHGN